jgi:hypothetical protein
MFAEARLSYETILVRRFWFHNESENGRSCETTRRDIPRGLSLLQCQWFASSPLLCLSLRYPLHYNTDLSNMRFPLFFGDVWWLSEMLVVEELYKEAVVGTSRKLIIFNGELDRIRSGCILPSAYTNED